MLTPQHPQEATDPGSWESHPNWITVLRQSGCWDGGLLSGDLQLRKFRHWEINTEDLFKLFSIAKFGGWIPPQFLWNFWPIVHFPRMFVQTNQLQAKSLYSHTSLLQRIMALQFSSMGPMDTYQPEKHPKKLPNDSLSATEHFCKKIKLYFLYGLTSCSTYSSAVVWQDSLTLPSNTASSTAFLSVSLY